MNENEELMDFEDEEEQEEESQQPSRFSGIASKILIYTVIAICLVLIQFLIAFLVVEMKGTEPGYVETKKEHKYFEEEGPPATFPIKKFRVPLDPRDDAPHVLTYVQAEIFLAYPREDVKLQQELSDRSAQIADKVQTIISQKMYSDINTSIKREKHLKPEIINAVNEILDEGEILDVYFVNMTIQRAS